MSLWVSRIGSPLLAAQAAAGIAKAGSSALAMTTLSEVAPRAAAWNASIARASAKGSGPTRSVVFRPLGRAVSPIRSTCAPPAACEPVGASAASASALAGGRLGPWLSSSGARMGADISTEAASAVRQSAPSTSATAPGRPAGVTPG